MAVNHHESLKAIINHWLMVENWLMVESLTLMKAIINHLKPFSSLHGWELRIDTLLAKNLMVWEGISWIQLQAGDWNLFLFRDLVTDIHNNHQQHISDPQSILGIWPGQKQPVLNRYGPGNNQPVQMTITHRPSMARNLWFPIHCKYIWNAHVMEDLHHLRCTLRFCEQSFITFFHLKSAPWGKDHARVP